MYEQIIITTICNCFLSGDLKFAMASEVGGATITFNSGSTLMYKTI